jgi:hypothetical protein
MAQVRSLKAAQTQMPARPRVGGKQNPGVSERRYVSAAAFMLDRALSVNDAEPAKCHAFDPTSPS